MKYEKLIPGESYYDLVPDPGGLVKVMQRYGLYALGASDGCACTHFTFRAVSVDVSCHKSGGSCLSEKFGMPGFYGNVVRVHSNYLGVEIGELVPVADEIARQLREGTELPCFIRLCDWSKDNDKTKLNGVCVYCGNERSKLSDYLCMKCKE